MLVIELWHLICTLELNVSFQGVHLTNEEIRLMGLEYLNLLKLIFINCGKSAKGALVRWIKVD